MRIHRIRIQNSSDATAPVVGREQQENEWIEAVKKRFDAEGVGMPYPYTELTGSIQVEQIDGAVADD